MLAYKNINSLKKFEYLEHYSLFLYDSCQVNKKHLKVVKNR